jgi:hypothetical protein
LIHGLSRLQKRSIRPEIVDLSGFLDIHNLFSMKSIFTTVKRPEKRHAKSYEALSIFGLRKNIQGDPKSVRELLLFELKEFC